MMRGKSNTTISGKLKSSQEAKQDLKEGLKNGQCKDSVKPELLYLT